MIYENLDANFRPRNITRRDENDAQVRYVNTRDAIFGPA